jgi:selT/selW/selH-like putative selenoprotein
VEKELYAAFSDISVQLIPGHGGVFEVALDDRPVFTKLDAGRFPDAGEITTILKDEI